eukprot:TRINITY_DN6889_c0_g1_i2.p1 TRINITY_DN6889_c0_g1~~TRINITY_DN6889_c0_g1_i2.p1  ORF type:complete len:1395 (+),score=236.57 TRINITY_DN6889_c0_g1_i2:28-4185(+)
MAWRSTSPQTPLRTVPSSYGSSPIRSNLTESWRVDLGKLSGAATPWQWPQPNGTSSSLVGNGANIGFTAAGTSNGLSSPPHIRQIPLQPNQPQQASGYQLPSQQIQSQQQQRHQSPRQQFSSGYLMPSQAIQSQSPRQQFRGTQPLQAPQTHVEFKQPPQPFQRPPSQSPSQRSLCAQSAQPPPSCRSASSLRDCGPAIAPAEAIEPPAVPDEAAEVSSQASFDPSGMSQSSRMRLPTPKMCREAPRGEISAESGLMAANGYSAGCDGRNVYDMENRLRQLESQLSQLHASHGQLQSSHTQLQASKSQIEQDNARLRARLEQLEYQNGTSQTKGTPDWQKLGFGQQQLQQMHQQGPQTPDCKVANLQSPPRSQSPGSPLTNAHSPWQWNQPIPQTSPSCIDLHRQAAEASLGKGMDNLRQNTPWHMPPSDAAAPSEGGSEYPAPSELDASGPSEVSAPAEPSTSALQRFASPKPSTVQTMRLAQPTSAQSVRPTQQPAIRPGLAEPAAAPPEVPAQPCKSASTKLTPEPVEPLHAPPEDSTEQNAAWPSASLPPKSAVVAPVPAAQPQKPALPLSIQLPLDVKESASGKGSNGEQVPNSSASQASTTGSVLHSPSFSESDVRSELSDEAPQLKKEPQERPIESTAPPQGRPGATSKHEKDIEAASKDEDYSGVTQEAQPPGGWKSQRLDDGVFLLKGFMPKTREYRYRLQNKKLCDLEFITDISKGINVAFKSPPSAQDQQTCKTLVRATATQDLCNVGLADRYKPSQLALGFSWTPKPLDRAKVQAATANDTGRRRALANELKNAGIVASKLKSAKAIAEVCAQEGIDRFIDAEFFPDDAALFKDPSHPDGPPVIWKRPTEFCQDEIRIIKDGVKPTDIQQGALGDCWLLAALAALAEQPNRVKQLFGDCEYNELGVYEVNCFKNGRPTTVVVDDLFPCSPSTGKPCYAHSEGGELWVLLVEKAWAKMHGSYEQIEGGMPYRALMDMLGAAGKEISFEDERKPGGLIATGNLFKTLLGYQEKHFDMVAGTPGEDTLTKNQGGNRPSDGIVPGHAYTVLDVQEKEGVKLVKLRNPWGHFEWSGDWSDNSPLWTERMKRAFNPNPDGKDGEFWMCESDFFAHFSGVGVVFYKRSWAEARVPLSTSNYDMCDAIEFEVRQQTNAFITLIQKDMRIVNTQPYTRLAFALYGPQDQSGDYHEEVLRSNCWPVRELVEEVEESKPLQPGKYMVGIWNPQKVVDRELSCLIQLTAGGSAMGATSTIQVDEQRRSQMVFATAIGSKGTRKGRLGPVETIGSWMPNNGYAIVARGAKVAVTFDFSKCKGLQLSEGTKQEQPNKTKVSFSQGYPDTQMKLVGELQPTGVGGSVSYSVSASWTQSEPNHDPEETW